MLYTIDSIAPICQKSHAIGKKLVLATGFFDLLHTEHIKFLKKAKKCGDVLIVAIESDARAAKVKGEGRPIESQIRRAEHMLELGLADYAILLGDDFNTQTAYEHLIQIIGPDIYAVSSHTNYLENKKHLVEKYSGKLMIVHDWNPEISTSQIIAQNKI